MPRNVRNFWLELDIDGRKTKIKTGPRSKDGGFSLTVYMRNNGQVKKTLRLDGFSCNDGMLDLHFCQYDSLYPYKTITTKR